MHQGETVNPFDNGASCFTGSKNENGEAAAFVFRFHFKSNVQQRPFCTKQALACAGGKSLKQDYCLLLLLLIERKHYKSCSFFFHQDIKKPRPKSGFLCLVKFLPLLQQYRPNDLSRCRKQLICFPQRLFPLC